MISTDDGEVLRGFEMLWDVFGTFCDVLRNCGTFWDIVACYGDVLGTLKGHIGMFWNILGRPFSISGIDTHFLTNGFQE